MPQKHSLSLALIAFLPALLSAFGLFVIARMLKRKNEIIGELAFTGALMMTVGNLLGAVAKLLNATKGTDTEGMSRAAFLLLAPGAVCLAWALWQGLRDGAAKVSGGSVWLTPLFLNAGLLALTAATKLVRGGRAWVTLLLTVLTVAGVAAGVQLARRALQHQQIVVAGLFLLSLVMSLTLHRIGGEGSSAEATEWAKQVSNLIAQGALTFAAYKLSQIEMNA
ncbi:MAG TPA: hypothetical protein PKC13_32530 [Blastocatellia bacterium]|nr:hypothetical protein [Blastocatellia bacterium]HMX30352.1 hypothetical protein [Blastocatellia bacterium]HMY72413.1 hypothetical protein [Blastocatellia bacterium]HNG34009.1 hypothetical protein [Blastocatellia bacterium]